MHGASTKGHSGQKGRWPADLVHQDESPAAGDFHRCVEGRVPVWAIQALLWPPAPAAAP